MRRLVPRPVATRPARLAAALGVALMAVVSCGCGGGPAAKVDPASDAGFGTPTHRYAVRGEVMAMPSFGPPPRALKIQHEPIPEFAGRDGAVHVNRDGTPGMRAMTMEFPLVDPDEDVSALSVGAKVSFVLEVRWDNDRVRYRVTEIRGLPAETALDFTNPPPVTGAAGAP